MIHISHYFFRECIFTKADIQVGIKIIKQCFFNITYCKIVSNFSHSFSQFFRIVSLCELCLNFIIRTNLIGFEASLELTILEHLYIFFI